MRRKTWQPQHKIAIKVTYNLECCPLSPGENMSSRLVLSGCTASLADSAVHIIGTGVPKPPDGWRAGLMLCGSCHRKLMS